MKKKLNIKMLTIIGLMTAIICLLGPLSIPIGAVPISLATLAIMLSAYVIKTQYSVACCGAYLAIGMVGVPVFSNFGGGIGKLIGPTGGYLIGYLFLSLICGLFINKFKAKILPSVAGMVIGTAVLYIIGTLWLSFEGHISFSAALAAGVLPFIIGDCGKIVICAIIGPQIRKALQKANLMQY